MGVEGAMQQEDTLGSSVSSFVAAAHELKAPLALIRQLALELDVATVDRLSSDTLQQIILTSERSLRLTDNITRSVRLEDALWEVEPINAIRLCEEVAHELAPLYRAHGRSIRVKTYRGAPLIVAHRDLLRRIVTGFVDNALHYASDSVELSVAKNNDSVQLRVRDQGPIIPRKTLQDLQKTLGVPQPIAGRPQSSGIGLALASEFARQMRGTIGLSRHRDGTTFYVAGPASVQMSLL